MVNYQIIPIEVLSTNHGYNCAYTITQGDTNAYILKITYTDITEFDGTVTLRFTFPDGTYADRENVVIDGNTITYTMDETDYSQRNVSVFVRHADSTIIHTTLKIKFSNIRALPGNAPTTEIKSYPEWAADMIDYDITVGTVETLAPGADATASITGDVPDKVLNLGIPVGATGAQGDKGDKGDPNTLSIGSVDTLAPAEPATATITGTSPNQTLSLGIPKGDKGDKGDTGEMTIGTVATLAPGASATVTNIGTSTDAVLDIGIPAGYDGSAVPIDDASEAADRVLSAQYIKAQLSDIEDVALSRQLKYWNRPAAYKIKVAAGRFNMSWANPNGRMWIFPAGTVLYSDGTTPISTSTEEKPDVVIPAGGGYVWLVSAMWNGLYSLNNNDTDTRLTGSLADLPPLTYYLNLNSCSNVTGALADLPPLTYYLNLGACPYVTGSLADLPPLTYYLNLNNCSLVTGAYTAVNGDNVPTTTILTGTGLSATDMDNTLIAYAACTKTGGTFTATGKNRTPASDAAVLHLTTPTESGGLGWTVTGLTVV